MGILRVQLGWVRVMGVGCSKVRRVVKVWGGGRSQWAAGRTTGSAQHVLGCAPKSNVARFGVLAINCFALGVGTILEGAGAALPVLTLGRASGTCLPDVMEAEERGGDRGAGVLVGGEGRQKAPEGGESWPRGDGHHLSLEIRHHKLWL